MTAVHYRSEQNFFVYFYFSWWLARLIWLVISLSEVVARKERVIIFWAVHVILTANGEIHRIFCFSWRKTFVVLFDSTSNLIVAMENLKTRLIVNWLSPWVIRNTCWQKALVVFFILLFVRRRISNSTTISDKNAH